MSTLIEQFQSSFSAIILLDEIAIKSQFQSDVRRVLSFDWLMLSLNH